MDLVRKVCIICVPFLVTLCTHHFNTEHKVSQVCNAANIFQHLPTSSNIVKEPWSSFKLQALTKYRKQRFKDLSHVIFILPCECQTLSHFVANYDSFAERWQAQNTQNVSEKFGQNTSESLDMTFLMQFECMFERNESTKTKRSKPYLVALF